MKLIKNDRLTCLKPKYSLRRQLFLSYGVTGAVSIGVVVLIAILTVLTIGDNIKEQVRDLLKGQVIINTRSFSEHAADTLSKKFQNLEHGVLLLAELARDRVVGYPSDGWEKDLHVPFHDTLTGKNVYPILSDPLPADWNIVVNVNKTNAEEHVQERWPWYSHFPISTASASYRVQGQCDPNEMNQSAPTYYKNCTDANNDLRTGGVVQPTSTNRYLAEKASGLGALLKPVYEAIPDAKTIGIYFANSGAGSSLVFPGHQIDGTSHYESVGCDWMRQTNPNTGLPFATDEEISRCRPKGTLVPGREYNPLEREWCRDQALKPNSTTCVGPYLDAFVDDLWLLTFGKAIFDRSTGHFLGCTLLDVSVSHLAKLLEIVEVKGVEQVCIRRWDDGTVIYSSQGNSTHANCTTHTSDLDFCSDTAYQRIKSLVDFTEPWNPKEVREIFHTNMYTEGRKLIAAFPIPEAPPKYCKRYRPYFMVIKSVEGDIYDVIEDMEASVDEDVTMLCWVTLTIGILGLVIVLVDVWAVAMLLTRPLQWMTSMSRRIVHNSCDTSDASTQGCEGTELLLSWFPRLKTEITSLVSEFQSILQRFSGDCPSSVATPDVHGVFNCVSWNEDFGEMYLKQLFHFPKEGNDGNKHDLIRQVSSAVLPEMSHHSIQLPKMSHHSIPLPALLNSGDAVASCVQVAVADDSGTKECPQEAHPPVQPKTPHLSDGLIMLGRATSVKRENKDIPGKPRHFLSCSDSTRDNKGQIVSTGANDLGDECFESELHENLDRNRISRSPLFWWIVVLIVAPVLLTMTAICVIVCVKVMNVLPAWLEEGEDASIALETERAVEAGSYHAAFAKEIFVNTVGDFHLFSRVVSWLLFGGLKQADSFTEMVQATEECKSTPANKTCDFLVDRTRSLCDCRWNDLRGNNSCQDYEDSRALQKLFFAGQAQDADPITGSRDTTTYPDVDYSPNSTLWWNDPTRMPGSPTNATLLWQQSYGTVYDRTRVISASSVVNIPLYNYHRRHRKHLGMYVGFEADGMKIGYGGCDHSFAEYSHFQSTEANGAAKIRPNLCPLGKYGYDSRCRPWFEEGRLAGTIHLTAPYHFQGTNQVANSLTFSLVDSRSETYVGQMVMDFFPEELEDVTESNDRHQNGSIVLVTKTSDVFGSDTLAGPGYSLGDTSPPIQDLVLPCDHESSQNRLYFDTNILAAMKRGSSGEMTFDRRIIKPDMSCCKKNETIFISFAPVTIRAAHPVRSDDYTRGVNVSEVLVGSIGYIVPTNDLIAPYRFIEARVERYISRSAAILISLIAGTAIITAVILTRTTISTVNPVMILLEFVRLINKRHALHDIPPMQGGSREVNQVYTSLAKFYKILQFSNMSFFSGEMKLAYKYLRDALSLFRCTEDHKAIGIAANNLGNTLLTMRNQTLSTTRCFQVTGKCGHTLALQSYDEAISSSTEEYTQCLQAGQDDTLRTRLQEQLADRYFNRGLFFLTTAKDSCTPANFNERGKQDLRKAFEFDLEVRDCWIAKRQIQRNSSRYYERLLRRANGLTSLVQKGVIAWETCDIVELLAEADTLLFVSWNVLNSPLFTTLTPVGRLQQLEFAAIRYEMSCGNVREAARISTRMLIEDEYIEANAFSAAVCAFLSFFRQVPPADELAASELAIRRDFRRMLRCCKSVCPDAALGKNLVFVQDMIRHHSDCGDYILQSFCQKIYSSSHDNDFVIWINQGTNEQDGVLELQRKGSTVQPDWSQQQETGRIRDLNDEIRSIVQLIQESENLRLNDTWIILTTDREQWDPVHCRLSQSHHYLLSEIGQVNRVSCSAINIAIISVEADEDMAVICREICGISKESIYVEVRDVAEDLVDALTDVAWLVIGGGKKQCSIPFGVTMEKF